MQEVYAKRLQNKEVESIAMKKYIFAVGDYIVSTLAWDKEDAYIKARLMGYNGSINDIRLY